jgi:hypothetical protein
MAKHRCCDAGAYEPPWFHSINVWMSSPAATIAAGAAASIPFRRKTEIGEPAPGASHLEDLVHFVGGQREVENVDIL